METGDLLRRVIVRHQRMIQTNAAKNRTRAYKEYVGAVLGFVQVIEDAMAHGSFDECLSILKEGQVMDLDFFTRESPRQNLVDTMEMIEIGEVHYRLLRDAPKTYRDKLAAGYQKRDRIPPARIVPKDGMHYALSSYGKHLHSRHSPLLAEEETLLITTMVRLTDNLGERYYAMQCKAMGVNKD